ncbi:MAG: thiamine biosynthesis protein [Desulfopila sp.]|jgi:tRNA U34 2-thiouridine synthase MnmA/TrmU|nr:thiamine biosynthesis protein [Desulfopila sp.]
MDKQIKALALFSGGLDSILASRVVAAQGVRVIALKFVTPFFDYGLIEDPEGYREKVKKVYGLDVLLKDITKEYLQLLRQPAHGFGKNFNPCIDCKIFMFARARRMMQELGASFLISGEVLGQRPMSQRRDTLNVITRDSKSREILLRPLSAKLLDPTEAELRGWVDRQKLFDFSGRGRSRQIALASRLGITEFPAPAGGCRLADPILSKRIAAIYQGNFVIRTEDIDSSDIVCLMSGRQFLLPAGGWLVLGRNQEDNRQLKAVRRNDDVLIHMKEHPGPTALLRRTDYLYSETNNLEEDLERAMGLVVRYAKKVAGRHEPQDIVVSRGKTERILRHEPIDDPGYMDWMI